MVMASASQRQQSHRFGNASQKRAEKRAIRMGTAPRRLPLPRFARLSRSRSSTLLCQASLHSALIVTDKVARAMHQASFIAGASWAAHFVAVLAAVAPWGAGIAYAQNGTPAAKASVHAVDFVAEVQPIFARACYGCHCPKKQSRKNQLSQLRNIESSIVNRDRDINNRAGV